jgi:hypothetical protein
MSAVLSSKDGRCNRAAVQVEQTPVEEEHAARLLCIALPRKMMR